MGKVTYNGNLLVKSQGDEHNVKSTKFTLIEVDHVQVTSNVSVVLRKVYKNKSEALKVDGEHHFEVGVVTRLPDSIEFVMNQFYDSSKREQARNAMIRDAATLAKSLMHKNASPARPTVKAPEIKPTVPEKVIVPAPALIVSPEDELSVIAPPSLWVRFKAKMASLCYFSYF